MRRWMAAPLLFAATIGLSGLNSPPVAAQPDAPVEESFLTADGVQLHGLFHATAKNANTAPVVILMYPPGPDRDMTKGDWSALAKKLNKEGYHVFRFDWRGHGKSTDIKDPMKFWSNPYTNGLRSNFNGYIRGGPPKKPLKNTLAFKDIANPASYSPMLLNDLAAVRVHLDSKNDNKELNTSSIYLVGAETTATIGMAWLSAEWQRPAFYPTVGQLAGNPNYEFVPQRLAGGITTEAGNDISGCVWLSPSKPVTALIPEAAIKRWATQVPKLRENNPMLFLYADKDNAGKKQAEFFYNEVLVAEPRKGAALNKLDQTFIKPVKGANALKGIKLLGDPNLKTEDTVVSFLNAIQKGRAKLPSKARKYDTPYFIDVRFFDMRTP